jgi:phosphoribosylformylglycinamidine cyclo-ligase
MHADTAGTKTALAYVYWKETGDLSVWKGIAQDALVMNIDDMACAGVTDDFLVSSTIGRNRQHVPGEVITALIEGTMEFMNTLRELGIQIDHAGGETADVGDIVRTADVGFTVYARALKKNIVDVNIKPGCKIVGFTSFGKSTYEQSYNAGIGSNGLTSARHDLFDQVYRDLYPESYDPSITRNLIYSGKFKLVDTEPETGISYGKLALSPTRTYLPVIREILSKHKSAVQGIIHNTGGGQTKVMKFVNRLRIIKDRLFDVPPLFRAIQEQSGASWRDMHQVFNMGHRLEVYTDEKTAEEIIEISSKFGIPAQIIGSCEHSSKNSLTIIRGNEVLEYS